MGKHLNHTAGDIDTQLGGEGVRAAAPHLFGKSSIAKRPDLSKVNTTGTEEARGALDLRDAEQEEAASIATGFAPGTNVDTTNTLGVSTSEDQERALRIARREVEPGDPEGRGKLVADHREALAQHKADLEDPEGTPVEKALGIGKANPESRGEAQGDDGPLDMREEPTTEPGAERASDDAEQGEGEPEHPAIKRPEPGDDGDTQTETETPTGDGGEGTSTPIEGDASNVTHQGADDGGPTSANLDDGDHVVKPEGSVGDGAPTGDGEPSGDAQ